MVYLVRERLISTLWLGIQQSIGMKCFICTLGYVSFPFTSLFEITIVLLLDDPKRKVEFIVRDNEDNALENAQITVKMGEKVLAKNMKTSSEGKFEIGKEEPRDLCKITRIRN